MSGPIALVGGAEWTAPATPLDAWLLERSGSPVVTVVPTAARQHPDRALASAERYFRPLGGRVEAAPVLTRADAERESVRPGLASASFIYLAGGDPRYLASVLRETPAWQGMLDAVQAGALLAGSSAGAMVLCEQMVVPGSEAAQPGLGLVPGLAVLAHANHWHARLTQITGALPPDAPLRLLAIDEATGLVVDGGRCRVLGAGSVTLYRLPAEGPDALWSAHAPAVLEECL